MLKDKFRKLDVEHDSERYDDIIDPYEWNQNFKKIEEVVNENLEELRSITGADIPVVCGGKETDIETALNNAGAFVDKNYVDQAIASAISDAIGGSY